MFYSLISAYLGQKMAVFMFYIFYPHLSWIITITSICIILKIIYFCCLCKTFYEQEHAKIQFKTWNCVVIKFRNKREQSDCIKSKSIQSRCISIKFNVRKLFYLIILEARKDRSQMNLDYLFWENKKDNSAIENEA